MALSDEIKSLQDKGISDAKVLDLYKQYDPSKAADIDGLLKGGTEPSRVLSLLGDYDQAQAASSRTLLGALRQGAAEVASGEAATAREALPSDSTTGQLVRAAGDAGADMVRDPSYVPASEAMGKGSTWGQWFKALPYRVAESLPGTGQDLAAGAAGGAIGGLGGPFAEITVPAGAAIGYGASYLSRNFGRDAESNAEARTGQPGTAPTTSDKERALAQGAIGAALSRIGLGAAGGTAVKAGEGVLGSVAAQAVKGAAADAGTAVAADAAHQALTPGNGGVDTSSLLNAAALGAVQGVGVRGARGVSDAVNAQRFSDVDPTVGQRLAARLNTEDTSTPSASYDALANVRRDLGTEVSRFSRDAAPQVRDLANVNGPSDDTALMLDKAKADLRAGQPLDPDTLDTLSTRLGGFQEGANLVSALSEHSALNQVVGKGTENHSTETFGGGFTGNPLVQQLVKPFGRTSLQEAAAASAVPAILGHGLHPEFSAATLGGQAALYTAMSGVDQLLGVHNPLGEFATRFAPDSAPPSIMASNTHLPSFRQQAQPPGPGGGGNGGGPTGSQPLGNPGPTPGPIGSPPEPISPQPPPTQPTSSQMPSASSLGPAIGIPAPQPTPQLSMVPARPVMVGGRVVLAKADDAPSPEPSPTPMTPTSGGATNSPTPTGDTMHPALQAAIARQQAQATPAVPTPNPTAALIASAVVRQQAQSGSSTGPKGAHAKPRGVEQATLTGNTYHHDTTGQRISVTRGAHTVNRSAAGVADVGRYADRIHDNLGTREQAFDRAKAEVSDKRDVRALDQLHHDVNQRASSWSQAYSHLEDTVNGLHAGDDVKGRVLDHLSTPKFIATWGKHNTN